MDFKIERLATSLGVGLSYLSATIKVTIVAVVLGSVLALLVALARHYRVPVLSQLLAVFVTIYRGIPFILIIQIAHLLYVMYFNQIAEALNLSVKINDVDIILLAYIVLTISVVPGVSETFRGALKSIDKTQYEASSTVGLTTFQSLRRIIIPQMFPTAFPNYVNNIIGIAKSVPLFSTIGIIEIMQGSLLPCATTYSYLEGYAAAMIIYFVLILLIIVLTKRIEKHLIRYI